MYVELLPASPKFHSVFLYDRSFSDNWGLIGYNGEFEISEKYR